MSQPAHQRKLRNYLLDKRFQLKYTGIVIGITAISSAVLGYYLRQEIVVSQETILARGLGETTHVIDPGDVEKRQLVSEEIDNEFNEALQTKLRVVVKINNAPAGSTSDFYRDHFNEEVDQKTSVLVLALLVFLGVLAIVWVYLTHRIAGPVYKLRLLFSKVNKDNIQVEGRLRKGDELQETFVAFQSMISRLAEHQGDTAKKLKELSKKLSDDPDKAKDVAKELDRMRKDMDASVSGKG